MHLNLTDAHKQRSDTLLKTPHISRQHETLLVLNRNHQTPNDTSKRLLMSTWTAILPFYSLFGYLGRLLVSFGFFWCLFVSWIVLRKLLEVSESIKLKCMYVGGFWCVKGCKTVFRPCMVQQTLCIVKALKGRNSHTWRYSNIAKRTKDKAV